MKKPTKAWQISLDFIRSSNKIYFLELNNNSQMIMTPWIKKPIFRLDCKNEWARGIGNTEYATKNYVKYLVKYLKSIDVNNVSLRYMGKDFNRLKNVTKGLAEHDITLSSTGFPIWSEPDKYSTQKTDWFGNDKRVLNENMSEFINDGITPIGKMGKYDKDSQFPNFVVKPPDGKGGSGVIFYKQEEIIEKEGYITQEFIVGDTVTTSLNFINGEFVKSTHSPRICDYRSKIIIDDLGNVAYVGTHRRTSNEDIPEILKDGEINEKHPYYHTYLCNISQAAFRTLLTENEELFWEDLCNKVGKTIYRLFLK